MKKIVSLLFVFLIVCSFTAVSFAQEPSMCFEFSLLADGKNEKRVETGDVITVTFLLTRTDVEENYPVYGMQNEITFDSSFFRFVEGSVMTATEIQNTLINLRDGHQALYMNYLNMNSYEEWNPKTTVGTFQLEVIGTKGSSIIKNENYLLPLQNGKEAYITSSKDLMVVVSEECMIHFDSNGGSLVEDQIVRIGEALHEPTEPTKDGLYFVGWYLDYDGSRQWDFGQDRAFGNMTLYAKWSTEAIANEMNTQSMMNPANTVWIFICVAVVFMAVLLYIKKRKEENK